MAGAGKLKAPMATDPAPARTSRRLITASHLYLPPFGAALITFDHTPRFTGHAVAAPPSSVMNSRRLTAQCSPCFPLQRIAQVGSAKDLLCCGIRTHLLTASGIPSLQ